LIRIKAPARPWSDTLPCLVWAERGDWSWLCLLGPGRRV